MDTVTRAEGVVRGTLVAGPVFVSLVWLLPVLTDNGPITISPQILLSPLVLALAIVPGSILAIVPVAIGSAVMVRLGAGNVGLRHPAMWALAGAAPVALLTRGADDPSMIAALTATGAVAALAARSGTRWAA